MEKRQLNFNAPLLSARRYQSPTKSSELVKRNVIEKPHPNRQQSSPSKKLDWEMEQVTKPASVPFHWEQTPGKPKGEVCTQEEPLNTPKLPPARLSDAIRRNSGELPRLPPGRLTGPSRYNSGEIPRMLPGRVSVSSIYNSGERSSEPYICRLQSDTFSSIDHASLLEKLNESLNCKDESDTESEIDAYSDAVDALSRTESSSLNYSVSGLSGYQSSGVKPSGTFAVDAQTREFMMNRFLPAAKSVVLETPQYVVKKPFVVNTQPKQVRKKVISGEQKPSLKPYGSDAIQVYSQCSDTVESEDEEKEGPIPVKKSGKVWGIFPRFSVKNSMCIFNSLSGMKLKTQTPKTSAVEVSKLSRKAYSGPLDKKSCHVPRNKKFHSGLLTLELLENEKKLGTRSNQFLSSLDSSYNSGPDSLRRIKSGGISPYRNESPTSPFREGVGFLGIPKEVENGNAKKIASSLKLFKALQDVSRNQINERRSGLPGDAVEKTRCKDVKYERGRFVSNLPSTKSEVLIGFTGERLTFLTDRTAMANNNVETSIVNILEEGRKLSCISISADKVLPSIMPKPKCIDGLRDARLNRNLDHESRPWELPPNVILVMKDENNLESDEKREIDPACRMSPLPPPLPKSPSESWLWRTLSNPFSQQRNRSPVHARKLPENGYDDINTKWETIVKTSNLRHDHVRYSEDLTPHASRGQSK